MIYKEKEHRLNIYSIPEALVMCSPSFFQNSPIEAKVCLSMIDNSRDIIKILLSNGYSLSYKYASEADMLNVALFNKRAKQWREENPDLKGNMRDYASLNELLVLANMESYNAILIGKGMEQKERMIELRKLARTQLISLEKLGDSGIKKLEGKK